MKLLSNRPKTLFLFAVILFLGIVFGDQASKQWASELIDPVRIAGLSLYRFENAGILGGSLSDLDPWIVRIFFSVLFGFITLGGALLIHFLSHKEAPVLKWGVLVYLCGILGNVWDRMTTGSVTDFIALGTPGEMGFAFNLADIVVVIGFGMIVFAIFRESDALWHRNNQRQGFWIEPGFQRGFGILLVLTGFAHFFVIALYSFTFLKVFAPSGASEPERVIRDYLLGLFVLEGGAIALTFGVSVLFSHRMIGPLKALELFARRSTDESGNLRPLTLRRGDYFKSILETIASRMRDQNPRE